MKHPRISAIAILATLFLVSGCGGNSASDSSDKDKTWSGTIMRAVGVSDEAGLVSLSLNDRTVDVFVHSVAGFGIPGIWAMYETDGSDDGMLILYDTKGVYFPGALWGSSLSIGPLAESETFALQGSLETTHEPLETAANSVMLMSVSDARDAANLGFGFFQHAQNLPPLHYSQDGSRLRICASRQWFEREASIAVGVVLFLIPGSHALLDQALGVLDDSLDGYGILNVLDAQYGGVSHPGYIVNWPTNNPVCDSGEMITDLCVFGDQEHGLKIWDTAPLDILVEGHCDPGAECVPTSEVCNGMDDDCDGLADEGLDCGGEECVETQDTVCHDGDVWTQDSCGQPHSKVQVCLSGKVCSGGECKAVETGVDLCAPCSTYADCGDGTKTDICLKYGGDSNGGCARDCSDDPCPVGFGCAQFVTDWGTAKQCVSLDYCGFQEAGSGSYCDQCQSPWDCKYGFSCGGWQSVDASWCYPLKICHSDADCGGGGYVCYPEVQLCGPGQELGCKDGDSWWNDLCGNWLGLNQSCGAGESCSNGVCTGGSSCTPNVIKVCHNGDVYWQDSCGAIGAIYDDCSGSETCSNGQCMPNSTGGTGDYCDSCGSDSDCKSGWFCAGWEGGSSWCTLDIQCQDHSDCGDPTYACLPDYSVCAPFTYAECKSGDVWVKDTCGSWLGLLDECGADEECSGGECVSGSGNNCPNNGSMLHDVNTGLCWQRHPPNLSDVMNGASYWDAKAYCGELTIYGYGNWRVPTLYELRSIVSGCSSMEIGGACDIYECYPTDPAEFNSPDCQGGCAGGMGPGYGGLYLISDLSAPDVSSTALGFWSSDHYEGANTNLGVDIYYATLFEVASYSSRQVRCVK
jgi:hypothetical protein